MAIFAHGEPRAEARPRVGAAGRQRRRGAQALGQLSLGRQLLRRLEALRDFFVFGARGARPRRRATAAAVLAALFFQPALRGRIGKGRPVREGQADDRRHPRDEGGDFAAHQVARGLERGPQAIHGEGRVPVEVEPKQISTGLLLARFQQIEPVLLVAERRQALLERVCGGADLVRSPSAGGGFWTNSQAPRRRMR